MFERCGFLRTYQAAFGAQFRATLAVQLQYRVATVIWLLFFILKPLIFLSVWSAVARSTGGTAGGYTPEDVAAYFIVTMWIVHLTFNGVLLYAEARVRQGAFSQLLLLPIHPISGDVADNLAYKAITAPLVALATLVLVFAFQPRLVAPAWAILAFVPALLLAYAIRFLTTWTVALAAFWLTRIQAVIQAYLALLLFLGGEAAPLALLPAWVQAVAWWSPFPWQLAYPAELVLGHLSPAQALAGLGVQLLWVAASLALLAIVWRAAVRRYAAVGG
jgi:ABC-2 type transport system permease protein